MIDSVDAFRAGEMDLSQLVAELHGLVDAADVQDAHLLSEWRDHAIDLDFELHMESEGWPQGEDLDHLLSGFRVWARRVLAATGDERT
jgi:hypothetical protein